MTQLNRVPPNHLIAEINVLGAMLQDGSSVPKAIEILKPEDFYREAHRLIFDAMRLLFEKNEPIDVITVSESLRQGGKLEKIGGEAYLIRLTEDVATSSNIEIHSKQIKNKSLLRHLIHTAEEIAENAYTAQDDAIEIISRAEQQVFNLAQDRIGEGFKSISEIIGPIFDQVDAIATRKTETTGVPTPYTDLNKLTSGFQESDLVVLAARPSMGKTSLALNLAARAAIDHKKIVGIFSLEMSKESLVQRMICSEAHIDFHRFRNGYYGKNEIDKLASKLEGLYDAPVYIDDTPNITVLEMKAVARRLQSSTGLDMLILDYLQLMRSTRRVENRVLEIADITRSLKIMARELRIPIIALSQLSRAVENRPDKRPQLSDLRESGSIEQDADMVLFIYRPEVYKREEEVDEDERGLAEIFIGKHRNGPCGRVPLTFIKEYMRFENRLDYYDSEVPPEDTEIYGDELYEESTSKPAAV